MKTRVDLAGLAVLIALLVGTALAGVVGAIVSVPTAALVAVLMDEYVVHHEGKQAGRKIYRKICCVERRSRVAGPSLRSKQVVLNTS